MNIEEYFDAVSESVNEVIEQGVDELRADLSKSRAINASSSGKLDEACDKLKQKMKGHFDKNVSKFGLYSVRNVFRPPTEQEILKTAQQEDLPVRIREALAELQEVTAEEEQLTAQLENLRREYLEKHREYSRIANECQDTDALIKDMRNTAFSVRLRLQDMDQQFEVQSLAETTSDLSALRTRLGQQINAAEEQLRHIQTATHSTDSGEMDISHHHETSIFANQSTLSAASSLAPALSTDNGGIRTGSTEALQRIANALQSNR